MVFVISVLGSVGSAIAQVLSIKYADKVEICAGTRNPIHTYIHTYNYVFFLHFCQSVKSAVQTVKWIEHFSPPMDLHVDVLNSSLTLPGNLILT